MWQTHRSCFELCHSLRTTSCGDISLIHPEQQTLSTAHWITPTSPWECHPSIADVKLLSMNRITLYRMNHHSQHIQNSPPFEWHPPQQTPLDNRVFAMLFPSENMPATLHWSGFTDKYFHSMVGLLFRCISWLTSFFRPFFPTSTSSFNYTTNSICYAATMSTNNPSLLFQLFIPFRLSVP